MLETALAQLRFGVSLAFGTPYPVGALDRIVDGLRQAREEMGPLGADAAGAVAGPQLDGATRLAVQARRFRSQAVRAAAETPFYGQLFGRLGLDPRRLTAEAIADVPPTPKHALRDDPHAFVSRRAASCVRVTSTGTTGAPTSVFLSPREIHVAGAVSAIGFIARGVIDPDDIVQSSISARATIGVLPLAHAAESIGAALHVAGLVSAEHTLALLAQRHRLPRHRPQVGVLQTYPSHLAELVETGLRLGYGPSDFGLHHVVVGGEILTDELRRRVAPLFGEVEVVGGYGMTELLPYSATECSERHLHFDPSGGLTEVLRLDRATAAGPEEPGRIVATPFRALRQTTLLLRYDTEDVVAPAPGSLTCELRPLPATGPVLGKLRLAVRHDEGWTFVRDVAEAVESSPGVSLPARYGFRPDRGGVAVDVAVTSAEAGIRRRIRQHLEEGGVPVRELRLVEDPARVRGAIPLRCDLREGAFPGPGRVGAGTGAGPALVGSGVS